MQFMKAVPALTISPCRGVNHDSPATVKVWRTRQVKTINARSRVFCDAALYYNKISLTAADHSLPA